MTRIDGAAHVHEWKRIGCSAPRDERCHPDPGMCACFDGVWACECGARTGDDPAAAESRVNSGGGHGA